MVYVLAAVFGVLLLALAWQRVRCTDDDVRARRRALRSERRDEALKAHARGRPWW